MIINGVTYTLNLISEEDRLFRLNHNLNRGNYPITDPLALNKLNDFVNEETSWEFLLPIPKKKVLDILGAEAYPIHIVRQGTIDKNGQEMIKFYYCHDLSYNPKGKD